MLPPPLDFHGAVSYAHCIRCEVGQMRRFKRKPRPPQQRPGVCWEQSGLGGEMHPISLLGSSLHLSPSADLRSNMGLIMTPGGPGENARVMEKFSTKGLREEVAARAEKQGGLM